MRNKLHITLCFVVVAASTVQSCSKHTPEEARAPTSEPVAIAKKGPEIAMGRYCVTYTVDQTPVTRLIKLGFTPPEVDDPPARLAELIAPNSLVSAVPVGLGRQCEETPVETSELAVSTFELVTQKSENQRKQEFIAFEERRLAPAMLATPLTLKKTPLNKIKAAVNKAGDDVSKVVSQSFKQAASISREALGGKVLLNSNSKGDDAECKIWTTVLPVCWFGGCDCDGPAAQSKGPKVPPQDPQQSQEYYVIGRFSCVKRQTGEYDGSCDIRVDARSCQAAADSVLEEAKRRIEVAPI
jgi:hypothetical protein